MAAAQLSYHQYWQLNGVAVMWQWRNGVVIMVMANNQWRRVM